MPRLIVLNGPPGCGKSTLAQMYVADHPLALNLDVDRVRGLIGRWQDHPGEAGLLARAIALAAARAHLEAGHDVVVPQLVARPGFLGQLERLACDVGAAYREVVLLDSKENALRRFAERSRLAAELVHREAQEMVERSGGETALAAMYDRLVAFVMARPDARIVHTEGDRIDQAYRDFLAALE